MLWRVSQNSGLFAEVYFGQRGGSAVMRLRLLTISVIRFWGNSNPPRRADSAKVRTRPEILLFSISPGVAGARHLDKNARQRREVGELECLRADYRFFPVGSNRTPIPPEGSSVN